ncbi:MAG TPA: M56 family metallopeptidase, partial [Flavitalea sp.]|nr:M56 family metallopeptidase [Flavitalea sp.]
MYSLFINSISGQAWIQAFAWTLVHSIWQGTIAAIFAGLIIILAKKYPAAFRYRLFTLVFILFQAGILITFYLQLQHTTPVVSDPPLTETGILPNAAAVIELKATGGVENLFSPWLQQAGNFFQHYYQWLVAVWFLIFFIRLAWMINGVNHLGRLRRSGRIPLNTYWQTRLNELSSKIGISHNLTLLESQLVTVPMVIGYFRPVILIPFGLLCHLPPKEMEAILLHELAHIRRSDYLINLVQTFTEAVFFFHPCVLWLSSLIREERENCCDDLAIRSIDNTEQYIHALVSFQEYNLGQTVKSSVAFAGTRHRLLGRIKRLISNENKKLNYMEKMILVSSMFVLTAVFVITSKGLQAQERTRVVRESQRREAVDTIPPGRFSENGNENNNFKHLSTNTNENNGRRTTTIVARDGEGKKYVLKTSQGKVTELTIDGEEIDADDYNDYREIIEQLE